MEDILGKRTNKVINPLQNNSIVCDEGTVIKFKKNGFVDTTGKPYLGLVNLEVLEMYSTLDRLKHSNMVSISSDSLLSSNYGSLGVFCMDSNYNTISYIKDVSIEVPKKKNKFHQKVKLYGGNFDEYHNLTFDKVMDSLNEYKIDSVNLEGVMVSKKAYVNYLTSNRIIFNTQFSNWYCVEFLVGKPSGYLKVNDNDKNAYHILLSKHNGFVYDTQIFYEEYTIPFISNGNPLYIFSTYTKNGERFLGLEKIDSPYIKPLKFKYFKVSDKEFKAKVDSVESIVFDM